MKKSTLLLVTTLLLLNSCGEPEIRYVNVPCPEMQTWKVKPLEGIDYEVRAKR